MSWVIPLRGTDPVIPHRAVDPVIPLRGTDPVIPHRGIDPVIPLPGIDPVIPHRDTEPDFGSLKSLCYSLFHI